MPQKNNKNKKNNIARINGQGNYYTDKIMPVMQQIVPKGSFARAGNHLGNLGGAAFGARYGGVPGAATGAQYGSQVGRYLGSRIASLTGFGDYTVQNNTLFKQGMAIPPGEAVPMFGVQGAETRIQHREYIQDIVVPAVAATYTNTAFTINPGDTATFPWLAAIASNYQQYKINGMIFEFKTLSSDYSAAGPLGAVVLATNYNVLEAAYPDKIRMENAQFSVSAKPSQSQIHTIECDPKETFAQLKYIRDSSSSTTTSQDARLYDHGKFQLATAGLPGSVGAVLGELWCSYDISLYKPEIVEPPIISSKVVGAGTLSKTAILGSAPVVTGAGVSALTNTLTFTRPGQYLIEMLSGGTVIIAPTLSGTATSSALLALINGAVTIGIFSFLCNVTAPSQTLIFDGTGSATVTSTSLRCAQYTNALA